MRRPLHTLKIWGAGVNSPRSYGAEFVVFFLSFCLFVCPSRYDARHRMPRRFIYALNLGGTGIRPPDSFSYRSNFRSRSSSCSTTSGDIFYCSGSRQLNHSSLKFVIVALLVFTRVSIGLCCSASTSCAVQQKFRSPYVCHTRVLYRHCVNTAEPVIEILSLFDRPIILIFRKSD